LAESSIRFANCHASDTPCLPSRAALFSGRFGINNGVVCHDGPASQMRYPGRGHYHDPSRPLWMRYFQNQGWQTVGFSGFGQRHLAWWFFTGFTQNFGNQLPGGSESADEVNEKALSWLRTNGTSDNWFMHVNYWDVHHPYKAPQRYFDRVSQYPGPVFPDEAAIHEHAETIYGPRTARDWWINGEGWLNPGNPDTVRMPTGNPDNYETYMGFVNGHDAGIAYVDEKVGELLATLEQLGIRDETAVIVTSDHGESIGELGMYFEHGNCCEGTTHVPLPPTVLSLLGMDIPENWDGLSYDQAFRGSDAELRDHLVLGTGIYSYQRAVRTPQHRLIRTIHPGLYPYDPLYLYDLTIDPYQTTNLAESQPEIVAQLDHLMLDWLWRYTTGPDGVRDPFQEQLEAEVTPDLYCPQEQVEERLKSLGREDQLAGLRRRRDRRPAVRPG
jgi:arylsulfatase A-like enzyme